MRRPAPLPAGLPRAGLPRARLPRAGLVCAGLVCLALLAACGRKGDLMPPDGEMAAYDWPKQYPAPQTVVPKLADEVEEKTRLSPRSGFDRPQTLPSWNGSRKTTTVYGSSVYGSE